MKKILSLAISAIGAIAITAAAAAQTGPVADACKEDIAKYCAGKSHGSGEIRACLEENKEKVTASCKTALETTGGGQGRPRQ